MPTPQNLSQFEFEGISAIFNFTDINENTNTPICLPKNKPHKIPKGTGGSLNLVKEKIKNDFFLINGDSIFDINFFELIHNLRNKSIGSMALVKNDYYKQNKKLSSLDIDKKENRVIQKKNSKFTPAFARANNGIIPKAT